jgi:NitT/TauT family transport system substrate-binding protein
VVRVGIRPYLTNAPLYVAAEEGYFEDAGLDVRFRRIAPGEASYLPALEQGELDVLATAPSAGLFNLIARGGRLRIVAGKGNLDPDACSAIAIVAAQGVFPPDQLGSPATLAGRRFDVNTMNAEGFYVERYLRSGGLSLDDVEIVNLPVSARLDAMRTGAVEVAGTTEPWLTRLLDAGHPLFEPANRIVPGLQWGVLLFSRRLLTEEPDTGARFAAAYLRGVRRYGEGKTARNLEILADRTGLDLETVERVCWPTVRPDGNVDTASLREYQEWMLGNSTLDRVLAPAEYLDPSPVQAASEGTATGPEGAS